jgi:hypothetical protein
VLRKVGRDVGTSDRHASGAEPSGALSMITTLEAQNPMWSEPPTFSVSAKHGSKETQQPATAPVQKDSARTDAEGGLLPLFVSGVARTP